MKLRQIPSNNMSPLSKFQQEKEKNNLSHLHIPRYIPKRTNNLHLHRRNWKTHHASIIQKRVRSTPTPASTKPSSVHLHKKLLNRSKFFKTFQKYSEKISVKVIYHHIPLFRQNKKFDPFRLFPLFSLGGKTLPNPKPPAFQRAEQN